MIYADYNATTPTSPEVVEAMLPYFTEHSANPSATHKGAVGPKEGLAKARAQVASLLGAHEAEILFTAGGTESDNIALSGAIPFKPEESTGKTSVLVSSVEHPAILAQIPRLQERGYTVHKIRVEKDGSINREQYRELLATGAVALVSVMWANNETGVIYPIAELCAEAHDAGALFHTDAVQAVGRVPVSVAESNVDLLSLSGHKLYGPKGVGALYVRHGVRVNPISWGGGQENGLRPGTLNVPGIVGLGRACDLAGATMEQCVSHLVLLRDRIQTRITEEFPTALVAGAGQPRLPNTLNIAFKNIESEMILMFLDKAGICASAGSACSAASHEASHVLQAMKLGRAWLYGVLRISIGNHTTTEEADILATTVIDAVRRVS